MRPTLTEQLRGLRHILEVSVAPAVVDEYATGTLQGVIRALEMLEQRANDVPSFLAWDNERTAALLAAVATHVPSTSGAPEPAANATMLDPMELDAINEHLRGQLADAIAPLTALASHDTSARATYDAVIAHLRERIARFPYTSTGALPAR